MSCSPCSQVTQTRLRALVSAMMASSWPLQTWGEGCRYGRSPQGRERGRLRRETLRYGETSVDTQTHTLGTSTIVREHLLSYKRLTPDSCTHPPPHTHTHAHTHTHTHTQWMQWHPHAHVVLVGTGDGGGWMWRVPSGDCKTFQGHGSRNVCAAIMTDGV